MQHHGGSAVGCVSPMDLDRRVDIEYLAGNALVVRVARLVASRPSTKRLGTGWRRTRGGQRLAQRPPYLLTVVTTIVGLDPTD